MIKRDVMIIDLGRHSLRALVAGPKGRPGHIKIKRSLIQDIPADIKVDDPQTLGQWVNQQLRAAGFPQGKAIVAVGREHVGLKRITLPSVDRAELPDMTRLAMQRELPFDAEAAIIDFVPVDQTAASTTVLAVAIPNQVVERTRAVMSAAGLTIERMTLRTFGTAFLLRDLCPDRAEATEAPEFPEERAARERHAAEAPGASSLGIDILGDSVEFCVVAGGSIRFSRAAEVPHPQDRLAIADAVVTETRRTWMSYRVGENASEIAHALIMGDQRVSVYAAAPVSEMLNVPATALIEHPLVDGSGADLDGVWPLAGLALEQLNGNETIDFANPRKAPDLAARSRQRRLAVAGIAIVALLGLWTAAHRQLESLRTRAETLANLQRDQSPQVAKYWRDAYKLEHLKQWGSSTVDWLQHAAYLASIAPPPDKLVLDSWTGTVEAVTTTFNKSNGKWSTDEQLKIVIDGEAKDRETADSFRAALVQNSIYTAATPGPDARGGKRMPSGFIYQLRTKTNVIPAEPAAKHPASGPAKTPATPSAKSKSEAPPA